MIRVGLSGGIGCGKSEAGAMFRAHGAPLIDADEIARELTSPGRPHLAEITTAFGGGVLDRDGRLDRARLRRLIFDDDDARRRLNAILHPAVRREIQRQTAALDAGCAYCVISVPLLIEAGMDDQMDVVVVIDCDERTRLRRVMRRDGCDEAAARKIMAAQAGRDQRLQAAHVVLDNGGDLAELRRRIERLHRDLTACRELRGQDLITRIR